FFLEADPSMPRTFGENQLHISQLAGWCWGDRGLHEVAPADPDEVDRAIGGLIAERIADGSTIQVGIGSISAGVLAALGDHRDLGV
ncbi:hypothetical protein ACPXA8_27695, partial [Klebsiella pneumoniae]|uniref:hypothetical protein n=1 Tax=Klebsiella pneumoniae TaxID=573 RepID=UPI003CF0953B